MFDRDWCLTVTAESEALVYVLDVDAAAAPTVLLLHGGGVAGWMWEPLRAELDVELRLLVPDLPGHDHSADEPYGSHDHVVDELDSLVEERAGAGPITVVGFSLGAQLGALLAARRPDLVDRLVLVSGQATPTPAPRLTLALLASTAGLARREGFARLQAKELSVPDHLLDDYLRTSATLSRRTLLDAVGENIRFTVPAGLRTFPGRALVLTGSREKAVVTASARAWTEAIPGSSHEVVEGAGHDIPLRRPEWLAARLRDLLGA